LTPFRSLYAGEGSFMLKQLSLTPSLPTPPTRSLCAGVLPSLEFVIEPDTITVLNNEVGSTLL